MQLLLKRSLGTNKLGHNNAWQKRIFSIDVNYLVCFKPEKYEKITDCIVKTIPLTIDLAMPLDEKSNKQLYHKPKWAVDVAQIENIYILVAHNHENKTLVLPESDLIITASNHSVPYGYQLRKAELFDVKNGTCWFDILEPFLENSQLYLSKLRLMIQHSIGNIIMIQTQPPNMQHFLRCSSAADFYKWLVLLCAKRIFFKKQIIFE